MMAPIPTSLASVLTRVGNVLSHTLNACAFKIAHLRASIASCASYPHSTRMRLRVNRVRGSAIIAKCRNKVAIV